MSAIGSRQRAVTDFISWLKEATSHSAALMSIGVFAFITLYFHDEWKYQSYKDYMKECVAVICWGWSFFLFQVCLLGKWTLASVVCGIIGTVIITMGVFCASNVKENLRVRIRFAVENLIWIISLILFCLAKISCGWFVWFSLSPILIIIFRCLIPYGLPNEKMDGRKDGKNE